MVILDSEIYRDLLEATLHEHGSCPVDLLIVDEIADWAKTRQCNEKSSPPAMAIVDNITGRRGILLRRSLDSEWIASILSRIELSGFQSTAVVLNSPEMFLKHLLLHELAHLENGWKQERESDCDAWAYQKLGIDAR